MTLPKRAPSASAPSQEAPMSLESLAQTSFLTPTFAAPACLEPGPVGRLDFEYSEALLPSDATKKCLAGVTWSRLSSFFLGG
jgi:hypothetical protein